jgi:hypothetical protein
MRRGLAPPGRPMAVESPVALVRTVAAVPPVALARTVAAVPPVALARTVAVALVPPVAPLRSDPVPRKR